MEEWDLRLAVMVYGNILISYLIWTPIHYFLGRFVLLKDCNPHIGHAEHVKEANSYHVTKDGNIHVEADNPRITSFLRYTLWYPMFVNGYTYNNIKIHELEEEIFEEIEKCEGEGSEGGSGSGSGGGSEIHSVSDMEKESLNRPLEVELVRVDVDIENSRL